MNRCPTCNGVIWKFEKEHQCPPRWLVWEPEECDEVDAMTIYARSPREAAMQWAQQFDMDCGNYPLLGEAEPRIVKVKGSDGYVMRFRVRGEMMPEYSAELVGEREANHV